MADFFCLHPANSTTRRVSTEKPAPIQGHDDKFKKFLFLPKSDGRKSEGGLRCHNYFKASTSESPLISVITVVFNGKQCLERSIKSVINQSYDNVEYIIIDGGSTDGTLDILYRYESSIDYWVSERDSGIYDAMNKGINLSTGKWIYFLGADDSLVPRVLEKVHALLKDDETVYYGNVRFVPDEDIYDGMFDKYKLLMKNICHQAMFFPRSVFKTNRYSTQYKYLSDYRMNLHLFFIERRAFAYLSLLVADYQRDGRSAVNTERKINLYKILILMKNPNLIFCRKIYSQLYAKVFKRK